MPSQAGNNSGFSSDEESANDSSFEKIDLDSDNEIIDKDAQEVTDVLSDLEKMKNHEQQDAKEAAAIFSALEKMDPEGVEKMRLTMKNDEVEARYSKPETYRPGRDGFVDRMSGIGEELERKEKKDDEIKEKDSITKEVEPDHWHEVTGRDEEAEGEMVENDQPTAKLTVEEIGIGEMDMEISEDEDEEKEKEELMLDITQAMEEKMKEEESEDIEKMLDVTQEAEDEDEEELERTAIEMEEEKEKEEVKAKKEKKEEKETKEEKVTRGEILSTILFILLMAGASYACVAALRPAKYYEIYEIFRGPPKADGSTQELIALPLDMVRKLKADSEERDALKKKVERMEKEAKTQSGVSDRIWKEWRKCEEEKRRACERKMQPLQDENGELKEKLEKEAEVAAWRARAANNAIAEKSAEIEALKTTVKQQEEQINEEKKKIEQVREDATAQNDEMTKKTIAEKNAEIEALKVHINERKKMTDEYRKAIEEQISSMDAFINRIKKLTKQLKQKEEDKVDSAPQHNEEKKSEKSEEKVQEPCKDCFILRDPAASEDVAARIRRSLETLVAKMAMLRAKLNENIKFDLKTTWGQLMILCVSAGMLYALRKWTSTDLPKNGVPIAMCGLYKTEAGFGFALKGRIVSKVIPGSAAEKGGLRVGDEIMAVNWVNVETLSTKKIRELFGATSQALLHVRQNPGALE